MKLPIKVKPYKHQRIAFNFALDKLKQEGCAALLMDMGLGKSLTSIAIAGRLYLDNKIEKSTGCMSNIHHKCVGKGICEVC